MLYLAVLLFIYQVNAFNQNINIDSLNISTTGLLNNNDVESLKTYKVIIADESMNYILNGLLIIGTDLVLIFLINYFLIGVFLLFAKFIINMFLLFAKFIINKYLCPRPRYKSFVIYRGEVYYTI